MSNIYTPVSPPASNLVRTVPDPKALVRARVDVAPDHASPFLLAEVPRSGAFTVQVTVATPFDGVAPVLRFALDGQTLSQDGVPLGADLATTTPVLWAFRPPSEVGMPANARLTASLEAGGSQNGRAEVTVAGNVGVYVTTGEPSADDPVGIYVVTA